MDSSQEQEFKNFIYKTQSEKFSRCFFPDKCQAKAIKAHSIQNKGVLEELAENGHVIMPQIIQNLDKIPRLEFNEVGKNKATTFTGLCKQHDNMLFKPIDDNPFDPSDEEHLFLLSYRSVLRELHSKCRAAKKVQNVYVKGVQLNYFDLTKADDVMMKATVGMLEAYTFFIYSLIWAEAYANNQFSHIKHNILRIASSKAEFAVSSVYSLIDNMKYHEDRQDPKCIVLNIFPDQEETIAIWSYPTDKHKYFIGHINELKNAHGEYQKYLLSKLVLRYCENLVLSPRLYNSFSSEKIDSIKKYFYHNIFPEKDDYEDCNLLLFN